MKEQEHVKGNAGVQGSPNLNRNFADLKQAKQEHSASNGGEKIANSTWNRSSVHKPKRRML